MELLIDLILMTTVLWVAADRTTLAIPAANATRVRRCDGPDAERVAPHLAACLEPRPVPRPAFIVDLDGLDGGEPFSVGLDAVEGTEEVLVRRLSPLIAGMGPYAGAIVRGDGSVRLALDVHALAPRARALGRVPEGRISEPPSRKNFGRPAPCIVSGGGSIQRSPARSASLSIGLVGVSSQTIRVSGRRAASRFCGLVRSAKLNESPALRRLTFSKSR